MKTWKKNRNHKTDVQQQTLNGWTWEKIRENAMISCGASKGGNPSKFHITWGSIKCGLFETTFDFDHFEHTEPTAKSARAR